jgi:hypothetical protein
MEKRHRRKAMIKDTLENSLATSGEVPSRAHQFPSDMTIQFKEVIEKLVNAGCNSDQIVAYLTAKILEAVREVAEVRPRESRLEAQDAKPGAAPDTGCG